AVLGPGPVTGLVPGERRRVHGGVRPVDRPQPEGPGAGGHRRHGPRHGAAPPRLRPAGLAVRRRPGPGDGAGRARAPDERARPGQGPGQAATGTGWRVSSSPDGARSTVTCWPSRTSPARIALASWSPIWVW